MKHLGKPITQRQLRVGEMIKQALGTLFIRDEAKIPNLTTREITVTEVRMSPDLKTAKIFVMPLGGKNSDEIIEKLKSINTTLIQDFGVRKPKIAVIGLNPHAGENGMLGNEEEEIIIPSIQKSKDRLGLGS